MKVQGNGQAKVLTSGELALLFEEGFVSPRDRVLFGICLFTSCLISEALGLRREDVGSGDDYLSAGDDEWEVIYAGNRDYRGVG